MKLINTDDTATQSTQSLLPAEPTPSANGNGFENMPITQNNPQQQDEFEILKQRLQGGQDENITQQAQPVQEENNESNETFVLPTFNQPTESPLPPETNISNVSKPATPKPVAPAAPKAAEKPKPAAPTTAPTKDLFKDVKAADKEVTPGIYIQIYSVSKFDPKSKEITAITKNGYEYKLYKTKVGDKSVTRVLVGPFSNDAVNAEVEKIRQNIAKEAFVFRIK